MGESRSCDRRCRSCRSWSASSGSALIAVARKRCTLPWTRMATVARIDARHMADMVKRGMSWGATPTHWWGCMDELPLALEASEMLIIEAREPVAPGEGQEKWERVTMAQAIESFLSRGQRVVMNTATNMPAARNV